MIWHLLSSIPVKEMKRCSHAWLTNMPAVHETELEAQHEGVWMSTWGHTGALCSGRHQRWGMRLLQYQKQPPLKSLSPVLWCKEEWTWVGLHLYGTNTTKCPPLLTEGCSRKTDEVNSHWYSAAAELQTQILFVDCVLFLLERLQGLTRCVYVSVHGSKMWHVIYVVWSINTVLKIKFIKFHITVLNSLPFTYPHDYSLQKKII